MTLSTLLKGLICAWILNLRNSVVARWNGSNEWNSSLFQPFYRVLYVPLFDALAFEMSQNHMIFQSHHKRDFCGTVQQYALACAIDFSHILINQRCNN